VDRSFSTPTRWLIFAPVAILALFSTVGNAQPIQGLNTTYYVIDEVPPLQSTTEYEECGSELENNINRSYDGEPYEDCTGDLFMVYMQGYITIPEHDTIEFFLASDDGGEITIGDNTFGLWQDQGCSATMSGNLTIEAGSQPLELWMYEHGGGSCVMLAWKIDNNDWEIVPEWAFTTTSTPQTTTSTTTVPTETVPVTDPVITTLPETTTSSVQTSTSLAPEPTMPEQSTTTTTTTTSTVPETTTTTEYVSPPVAQPPVVVEPEPIEEPTTEDTEPIQEPEEVVEEIIPLEPPDTDPTVETEDTLPFVDELVDDTTPVLPDDTTPTEVLPDEVTEETIPIEETPVEELNDEELLTAIESIEEGMEVSEELAVAVAQSAEVVASLSSEEATAVFEAIEVDNLSVEEAQAIVEAVQDAPAEVREAFEEEINIFSPGLDNYVPLGSNIPVSTRRTLIAVAAGAAIAAAGSRRP
jgi:hypothetical protein